MTQSLTAKQQRFVEEYCVDWNATQAAIRAGYSENTAQRIGSENLSKPLIQEAIQAEQQKISEATGESQEKVVADLRFVADVCMGRQKRPEGFDAKGAATALDKIMRHVGGYEKDNNQSKVTIVIGQEDAKCL